MGIKQSKQDKNDALNLASAGPALDEIQDSLKSLVALSADFYWEQDAGFCFTRFERVGAPVAGDAWPAALIGKLPWELREADPASAPLQAFRAVLLGRASFRNITYSCRGTDGSLCFFEMNGEPLFDGAVNFLGYRGTARDISQQVIHEEEARRFRAAMDVSGDSIYLVDRATMRFIDVNETACKSAGYTRQEFLQLGPQDVLVTDRQTLEHAYDAVIAGGHKGSRSESIARNKDGREYIFELQRRAIRSENRTIIVSIARDITARKRAEESAQRHSRMYAALSATNERSCTPRCRKSCISRCAMRP